MEKSRRGIKMSEVLKEMKERRSIRKYKADMVPQEILDQIIEAGLYAASGKGTQNTIIIQVTKKELRDEIAEMNRKIGGWEEGFETEWGKELLKSLGISGEYVGIGHCALGYADGETPKAAKRKVNRVFYIK